MNYTWNYPCPLGKGVNSSCTRRKRDGFMRSQGKLNMRVKACASLAVVLALSVSPLDRAGGAERQFGIAGQSFKPPKMEKFNVGPHPRVTYLVARRILVPSGPKIQIECRWAWEGSASSISNPGDRASSALLSKSGRAGTPPQGQAEQVPGRVLLNGAVIKTFNFPVVTSAVSSSSNGILNVEVPIATNDTSTHTVQCIIAPDYPPYFSSKSFTLAGIEKIRDVPTPVLRGHVPLLPE